MDSKLVSRFGRSRWALFGGLGVTAIAGLLIGVLLRHGHLRSEPLTIAAVSSEQMIDPAEDFGVPLGGTFPAVNAVTPDDFPLTLDTISRGRVTALLFWSVACEPCRVQAAEWKRQMTPRLKSDVNVIVCLDEKYKSDPEAYKDEVGDNKVVFCDFTTLINDFNMVVFPEIIVLDSGGRILHVEYGEDGAFDPTLVFILTGLSLPADSLGV